VTNPEKWKHVEIPLFGRYRRSKTMTYIGQRVTAFLWHIEISYGIMKNRVKLKRYYYVSIMYYFSHSSI
jgi:hypothetical protein